MDFLVLITLTVNVCVSIMSFVEVYKSIKSIFGVSVSKVEVSVLKEAVVDVCVDNTKCPRLWVGNAYCGRFCMAKYTMQSGILQFGYLGFFLRTISLYLI